MEIAGGGCVGSCFVGLAGLSFLGSLEICWSGFDEDSP